MRRKISILTGIAGLLVVMGCSGGSTKAPVDVEENDGVPGDIATDTRQTPKAMSNFSWT